MAKQYPLAQVVEQLEQGRPPEPEAGFLGAALDPAEAGLLLIPVPWEATTSYGGGTSQGPQAILKASHQLDLEDAAFGQPYRAGISFIEADDTIAELNLPAREAALTVIEALEEGKKAPTELALVNRASEEVNRHVYQQARAILAEGKLAAVVGGDHASPQGLIQALAEQHADFGILHLDAHHDLREAYEGFVCSHASIFFNVMEQQPQVSRLVQVGIRDYCRREADYARDLGERARVFYGAELFRSKAGGESWLSICDRIIAALPQQVYVSFDIDALDPPYCPNTGTPVPGGLSFDEASYLLERLAQSGRQIIGFDLCEVAPGKEDEWDANVGARILYKLCGATLRSQGMC
ncbi:MAG: agmatinase family protein [Thiohalomonadaceae bacterium]